ncbi:MAG: hypothetical protein P8Y51_00715, partial [Campylobacterales bacterium]
MKRDTHDQYAGLKRRFGSVLLVLSLGAAGTLQAEVERKSCEQADSGERIKCKTENYQAQMSELVDELTSDGSDLLTPEMKTNLKNSRDRTNRAIERTDAKGFKRMTKKSEPECYIKEFVTDDPDHPAYGDGDDDGICTKHEICEELLNDQVGDEDGICEKLHTTGKPIQEACVKVCERETIDANEENYDEEASQDVEDSLDEISDIIAATNEKVKKKMALQATLEQLSVEGEDACSDVLVGTRRFSALELVAIYEGATAAKLAADVCRDTCTQSSFGFNCRMACLAVGMGENIMNMLTVAAEVQDDSVTGSRVDAS